jgi:hypothetical protein
MAIKIMQVPGKTVGLTGEAGKRSVYALIESGEVVRRKGGKGSPMYKLTESGAEEMKAKEEARRATSRKRATSSTSKKAEAKLTVASCRAFLEGQGYTVTSDEDYDLEKMLEYGVMANPRKRTRKKQTKAAVAVYRGKKGASKFHLKRELGELKRAMESIRRDYNNDLISYDDYSAMEFHLEGQMEKIERELGMYDNPLRRLNPLPEGPYEYDPDGPYMEGYFDQYGGLDSGTYDFYTVRGRKTKATDGISATVTKVRSGWQVKISHQFTLPESPSDTYTQVLRKKPTPHDIQEIIDRVVSSTTKNVPGYGKIIQIRSSARSNPRAMRRLR